MSLPRYPAYKDSGVPWLGEVPAHWDVKRFKSIVAESKGGIWGEEPQGNDADIVCVRVADFDRVALRVRLDEPTLRNVTEREREGRLLRRGDLLLEKSGGGEGQLVGCVVLYGHDVPAVCSNFIGRLGLVEGANPGYWAYVFASAYDVRLNYQSVRQTSGIQNLDQAEYLNELAPIPPLAEQEAIAAFLDRETARVDALVAEQGRLIALLKEKRQAVISHAVTRGLNPDAPRKPSGVAWLGDVPAHWKVLPLGRTLKERPCYGVLVPDFDPSGVPMLRIVDIKDGHATRADLVPISQRLSDEYQRTIVEAGDLILSVVGTIGETLCVGDDLRGVNLSRSLARLQPGGQTDVRFLQYVLRSHSFRLFVDVVCVGSAQMVLNMGDLRSFLLGTPSVEEQKGIAEFLDRETSAIDALIAEAERAIALLGERRAALIAAAVTGRVDVRGVAAGEGV